MMDISKFIFINTDYLSDAMKGHAIKFAKWMVLESYACCLDEYYWNEKTIRQSYDNFIGTEPKEKE